MSIAKITEYLEEAEKLEREKEQFNGLVDNLVDCLQRAQERIKELGEVSPDLPYVTDDMALVDDIEKSLEDLQELFEDEE